MAKSRELNRRVRKPPNQKAAQESCPVSCPEKLLAVTFAVF